jgi:hypothetical protein
LEGLVFFSRRAYLLQADKINFQTLNLSHFHISVTETLRLELRMKVAIQIGGVEVVSRPAMIQTDTSALGRVVNESAVTGLPLVTRNFVQIAGLSPGVVVGVSNAAELGRGETALSQIAASNDGIFVHGAVLRQ